MAAFTQAPTLGDQLAKRATALAKDKGVSAVESGAAEGNPADEILELVKAQNVEMIVHGNRGLSQPKALFLGSVSHELEIRPRVPA